MKALVTGGTGFIGANLVAALLARGIAVRVLLRASSSRAALAGLECETATSDILAGRAELARAVAGCAWVFHVAAATHYWERKTTDWLYAANVDGTRNLLRAALDAGAERFVFTSSLGALGVPPAGEMLDETSRFNLEPARFPYGHSKALAELEVARAVEAGLEAVIVNPTVVLGVRDVNLGAGALVLAAARGRLRLVPPGGVNFVAVEDVVAGHIAAADRGARGERYILGGENLTYRAAAAVVCETVGRPAASRVVPAWCAPAMALGFSAARALLGHRIPLDANQVRLSAVEIYTDAAKAARVLGVGRTPFRIAVERTYEWYRSHGYLAPA